MTDRTHKAQLGRLALKNKLAKAAEKGRDAARNVKRAKEQSKFREEVIEAIIAEIVAPSDEFTRYDKWKKRKNDPTFMQDGSTPRNPYKWRPGPGRGKRPKRSPQHGRGGVMY